MSSETSLEDAKASVLAVEDEIAAYIPTANVTEVIQAQKATLLRCGDGYLWSGGTTLLLTGQLDQAGIVDEIAARFTADEGWTVKPLPRDDVRGFELRHDDGRGFFVDFNKSGEKFNILSFSECFSFEPELGEEY